MRITKNRFHVEQLYTPKNLFALGKVCDLGKMFQVCLHNRNGVVELFGKSCTLEWDTRKIRGNGNEKNSIDLD